MSKSIKILIVLAVIALIFVFRYEIYYMYLELTRPKSKNKENEAVLKEVHPVLRYKMSKIIRAAEKQGCEVKLNSGQRDLAEQLQLYQSGQTPAKESKHNYHAALDLNICGLLKASSISAWLYWGQMAEAMGLKWGGRFGNTHDPIHFELTQTLDELKNSKLAFGKYAKIWA